MEFVSIIPGELDIHQEVETLSTISEVDSYWEQSWDDNISRNVVEYQNEINITRHLEATVETLEMKLKIAREKILMMDLAYAQQVVNLIREKKEEEALNLMLQNEKKTLVEENVDLKEKLSSNETELVKREEKIELLEEELKEVQNRICQQDEENKLLTEAMESTNMEVLQKLENRKRDFVKISEENKRLLAVLEETKVNVTALWQENEDLSETINDMENSIKENVKENKFLMETIGKRDTSEENKILKDKVEKSETNIMILQERNYKSELSNCKKNKYIRYLQQENKQLVNQLKKMKRWSSSNKRVAQDLAKAEEQIWFKEQEAYKIVNVNKDLEKKLQWETKSAKVLYRKN